MSAEEAPRKPPPADAESRPQNPKKSMDAAPPGPAFKQEQGMDTSPFRQPAMESVDLSDTPPPRPRRDD